MTRVLNYDVNFVDSTFWEKKKKEKRRKNETRVRT